MKNATKEKLKIKKINKKFRKRKGDYIVIDEGLIKNLCKFYGFEHTIMQDGIRITTPANSVRIKRDVWLIEVYDYFMLLKHKSSTNVKQHYHYQKDKSTGKPRKFYDWEFLFKSMNSHK